MTGRGSNLTKLKKGAFVTQAACEYFHMTQPNLQCLQAGWSSLVTFFHLLLIAAFARCLTHGFCWKGESSVILSCHRRCAGKNRSAASAQGATEFEREVPGQLSELLVFAHDKGAAHASVAELHNPGTLKETLAGSSLFKVISVC